jgi:hypothetical protein
MLEFELRHSFVIGYFVIRHSPMNRPSSWKWWITGLSLALNVALVALTLTFGLPWLAEQIGGRKYELTVAKDLTALRKMIYQCDPGCGSEGAYIDP